MQLSSSSWRRIGALAFGAAVPSVLLGSILIVGHTISKNHQSDDALPPSPTQSTAPLQPTRQSEPPIVSDFQTDSSTGYANGLRSNELFDCQPVLQTPKPGGKSVLVQPTKCKARPVGK